jgi:hypothetical protein
MPRLLDRSARVGRIRPRMCRQRMPVYRQHDLMPCLGSVVLGSLEKGLGCALA